MLTGFAAHKQHRAQSSFSPGVCAFPTATPGYVRRVLGSHREQHPSAWYQRALSQVPGCFRAAAWVQLALTAPAPCTDFPAVCRPGPVRAPPQGCGSPPIAHRAAHGSAAIPRVPFAFPR